MKALVLSGGKGSRLAPITSTSAKQLVPVANKPVLFYVLEQIANSGISDVGIVVGDTEQEIRKAVGNGENFGLNITYIRQSRPGGLAHAIQESKSFLGLSDFLVFLGDNLLFDQNYLFNLLDSKSDVSLMVTKVDNPEQFGIVSLDQNNRIVSLIEKPQTFVSDLALVGIYLFKTKKIWQVIQNLKPSKRGELEITDAISELLNSGSSVSYTKIEGYWKDQGKPEDIIDANREILDSYVGRLIPENNHISNSKLIGRVRVGQNCVIENSEITGPCIIGDNCKIIKSEIKPYCSISDNCELVGIEIYNSVVMKDTEILGKEIKRTMIHNSLIGKEVSITSNSANDSMSLVLGDKSKIEI